MKKSMIAGAIAGIGTVLMVSAGMRTQGFDLNDVMFIVGTMCVTGAGIHLAHILEEVLNDISDKEDSEDLSDNRVPDVRPFNLPGSESRRDA